jgi:hypothetical protein
MKEESSEKKAARRFACWCVRNTPLVGGGTVWDLLTDESRSAVEVAERFLEGECEEEELVAARKAAWEAADATFLAAWEAAEAENERVTNTAAVAAADAVAWAVAEWPKTDHTARQMAVWNAADAAAWEAADARLSRADWEEWLAAADAAREVASAAQRAYKYTYNL